MPSTPCLNSYSQGPTSLAKHALIALLDKLLSGPDKLGSSARLLLIDFSNSFDHIGHQMLLNKMAMRGVPDDILKT